MFYTDVEKVDAKYVLGNAIGAAKVILKDRWEITNVNTSALKGKNHAKMVTLPEFNEATEAIIQDTRAISN